jgi:hypothetical protein
MKLTELFEAVGEVAQTGAPASHCEVLAREAESLADMVGWANGPIDPEGRMLERLAALQDNLALRHVHTTDPALAMLQNALSDLGRAIARHDEQLGSDSDGEDEGEDFT